MGVEKGKPLKLDLVIGDPFVSGVERGVFGIPFDAGEVEFMGDCVVKVFPSGVVVVGEVVDSV